ncbi:Alpha-(1,3)-fucosyltransferase 11 [Actinomortierella ambigua]|nr:Alpha-(1,3)-fucosyltransferase 11 [Actinomortierella ambigua]
MFIVLSPYQMNKIPSRAKKLGCSILYVEYDDRLTKLFSHLWTVTRDADFPDSYFQSGVDGLLSVVLKKPRMSLEEKNKRRKLPREQGGIAPVAWVVSNCHASNQRANYVAELARHIDIDIYGRCNPHLPWPKNEDGKELTVDELVEQYKFYLSFENSNCDDYVTEKLYRPFLLGNVPVVDGPRNYSRFSPTENALIQTDNFSNAAELAKYLKKLDADDEAYLSHLRYKVPKDPSHIPTLEDLSPNFVKEWYNEGRPEDWGTDGHGTYCQVCKFAHDMEEGIYQFDVNKRIGKATTCQRDKHRNVIVSEVDNSPPVQDQPPSPLVQDQPPPPLFQDQPSPPPTVDSAPKDKGHVVSEDRVAVESSEVVWAYDLFFPILLFALAVFVALFSKRLRRIFRERKHSQDKGGLPFSTPAYDL